jgi:4-amino-4-deoxy-L-arabinose transferase-like glycosyltransferase
MKGLTCTEPCPEPRRRASRSSGWVGSHRAAFGLALLIAVGAALRLAPIGANRFHEDEALYSFWALQITTGRDPILDHSPVDKPPLFIYTLALCFKLFGPSEVAARLPSELASAASIALLYYLAWRLYGRAVATLAAILMALSPFNILFAPTAFTDPLMVAWVLAALCLATKGHVGWCGLMLGLAAATKQQGLLFVPLAIVIATRRFVPLPLPLCSPTPPHPRTLLKEGLFFALGFLAVMAPVAWWDSLRWQLQPNYFEQSLISYGGLAFVDPAQLVERLGDWAEILHYITASPFLNVLLLVGLPCLLLYGLGWRGLPKSARLFGQGLRPDVNVRAERAKPYGLTFSPWRGLCPFSMGVQPHAFFDVVLSAFVIIYLLGHWVLSFNVWDRYLLGLVPFLLILLARILWLASGALASILPSLRGRGRGRVDSHHRAFLTVVLLAVTLTGPALTAASSGYPIGGDHGAYDGIEAVADYFRDSVPAGSILYHHWLGWHYSFYLFDFPLVLRWYPSPEELAEDARQVDDAQRYVVFPSEKLTAEARDALAEAGLGLHGVYSAYGRDGSISFTVYRIEARKFEVQG